MVLAGRVHLGDATFTGPVAFVLADNEIERVDPTRSRTFRIDSDVVRLLLLRIGLDDLRRPVGLSHGPISLPVSSWDACNALVSEWTTPTSELLGTQLVALAAAGVIGARPGTTMQAEEPERFTRLWAKIAPRYATLEGSISLKLLAGELGLSTRQVGENFKELARTFGLGLGDGYRDTFRVLRLRAAALLLGAPDATITDVACAVGYGGTIAMARAFRDARLPPPIEIQSALRSLQS